MKVDVLDYLEVMKEIGRAKMSQFKVKNQPVSITAKRARTSMNRKRGLLMKMIRLNKMGRSAVRLPKILRNVEILDTSLLMTKEKSYVGLFRQFQEELNKVVKQKLSPPHWP